jgi:thiol-disulfide isomerase/thioredoxin
MRRAVATALIVSALAAAVAQRAATGKEDGLTAHVLRELAEAAPARIGSPAPDFGWTDGASDRLRLSDVRTPVVINFWASWCEPCRRELPLLEQAAERNPDVTFLILNEGEDPTVAHAFLTRFGFRWLRAVADPDRTVALSYGTLGLPTTAFVDEHHVLQHIALGEFTSATLAAGLARVAAPPARSE